MICAPPGASPEVVALCEAETVGLPAAEAPAPTAPPPLDTRTATLNGFGVHGPWELFRVACLPDGVHPNLKGYRVMAPLAERAIREAMRR